jgi:hypothetical protein
MSTLEAETVNMTGPKSFHGVLAGTIGLAALLMAAEAHSQQAAAPPSALNPSAQVSGLRVDREVFAPPPASSTTRAMLPDSSPDVAETYQMTLLGSTSVTLETARFTSDGRYVRPRLSIGNESPQLRSWMNSIGVPAERCQLPTFRARVRRDEGTGDIGSTVWMSARCKFY